MSDSKKPIDPNAATAFPAAKPDPGFAQTLPPIAPLPNRGAPGFAQTLPAIPQPPANPLPAIPQPPHADLGFAQTMPPTAPPPNRGAPNPGFAPTLPSIAQPAHPPQHPGFAQTMPSIAQPAPQPAQHPGFAQTMPSTAQPAQQGFAQPSHIPYPQVPPDFGAPVAAPPPMQPGMPLAPQVVAPPPAKSHAGRNIVIALVVTGVATGGAFAITRFVHTPDATPPTKGSAGSAAVATGSAKLESAPGSAAPAAVGEDSFAGIIDAEHTALAGQIVGLEHVFAADAFGIGADASEAVIGGKAIVETLVHDLYGMRDLQWVNSWNGIAGETKWVANTIDVTFDSGKKTFALTQLIAQTPDHRFTVRAWHFARLVPNQIADDAAKNHELPTPEKIADHHEAFTQAHPQRDDKQLDQSLEETARHAFSSHDTYVTTLSTQADALSFGSAPGETMVGPRGEASFRKMKVSFALHDGVRTARVASNVGFAAANVSFTSTVGTQVFRVLAVFVHGETGWKIVQAQWSNGLPIPGA